jgi:hypothetical protein
VFLRRSDFVEDTLLPRIQRFGNRSEGKLVENTNDRQKNNERPECRIARKFHRVQTHLFGSCLFGSRRTRQGTRGRTNEKEQQGNGNHHAKCTGHIIVWVEVR